MYEYIWNALLFSLFYTKKSLTCSGMANGCVVTMNSAWMQNASSSGNSKVYVSYVCFYSEPLFLVYKLIILY